jgi:hypothetical protein
MLKEQFNNAVQKAWDLCVHTRIEMAVGAVLFTLPAAIMSYQHEGTKLGQIPLAFSELNRTVAYIENDSDEKVPPLTMFYSAVNDMVMQIFEANNAAYKNDGGSNEALARELERRFEPRTQADAVIADYADRIPEYAGDARATLDPLLDAYNDLRPVQEALDNAWSESHHDHYKNVRRSRRVCSSSNGKTSCSTQYYTDRVYQYTDHKFTYNAGYGEQAADLLNDFIERHPDVRIPEELIKATSVSNDNKDAIRSSRINVNDGKEPTEAEYLALTNTWATGSNYERLTPVAYKAHSGVLTMAPAWDRAKETAETRRYRTKTRSHSGPEQFQIAEDALGYVVSFRQNTAPVIVGIDKAAEGTPALEAKVKRYIDVVLRNAPGDAADLRGDIMHEARAIYKANYVAGFDVNPAKWYMVGVWGIIGMMAGTGVGFGADLLVANRVARRREDELDQPKTPRFGR